MEINRVIRDLDCDRHSDLLGYLYHESSSTERRLFEQHLDQCQGCRNDLAAFSRVREEMSVWQVGMSPRVEIAIARRPFEVFRELIGLFPVWLRIGGVVAAATAVLLVTLSLAGARVNLREGTLSLGFSGDANPPTSGSSVQPRDAATTNQLTRKEIETMISTRVAEARLEDSKTLSEMRVQVANLSARVSASGQTQARLTSTIATLRSEQQALAVKGQSTLAEWLFAANGSREPWGVENDKDN